MGSKIGTILSMLFVAIFFSLGLDLMSIQYIYADLDAKSVSISYIISKAASVNDSLINQLENEYGVSLTIIDQQKTYKAGEIVDFELLKYYQPIIMSKDKMTISVRRESIIGYYS